jgi:DNA-binding MarR family transcriptional regulator
MHDPRYTDPRPDVFGSLLVLVQHLSRRLDEALEPVGLTARQWLLLAVMERWFPNDSPTLTEAALRYGTSRQNVKQVALGLERRGYLRLVPDCLDRRAIRLELTEKVARFYEPDLRARRLEVLDDVFADLDPERIELLRDLVGEWLAVEARKRERQLLTRPQEG